MKLRDLLELCRVSNLPTVWSNAVMGLFAGLFVFQATDSWVAGEFAIAFTIYGTAFAFAMSLIYCGGMVMNDWVDREIDARERPNRPIPSGRVSAGQARNLTILFFFWGVVLVLLTTGLGALTRHGTDAGITALLLIACVVVYNYVHQFSSIAIVFMGLCRALIVVCGVALVEPFEYLGDSPGKLLYVIGPALTLFVYTVLISVVARREVDHTAKPRWFGGPKTVMNMIAAMPLLDAIWLLVMGLWPASLFCVACAGLTKLGHRKVAGS